MASQRPSSCSSKNRDNRDVRLSLLRIVVTAALARHSQSLEPQCYMCVSVYVSYITCRGYIQWLHAFSLEVCHCLRNVQNSLSDTWLISLIACFQHSGLLNTLVKTSAHCSQDRTYRQVILSFSNISLSHDKLTR